MFVNLWFYFFFSTNSGIILSFFIAIWAFTVVTINLGVAGYEVPQNLFVSILIWVLLTVIIALYFICLWNWWKKDATGKQKIRTALNTAIGFMWILFFVFIVNYYTIPNFFDGSPHLADAGFWLHFTSGIRFTIDMLVQNLLFVPFFYGRGLYHAEHPEIFRSYQVMRMISIIFWVWLILLVILYWYRKRNVKQ